MIFLFSQEQTKNANRMVPRLGVLRYPTSLINLPSVIIFLPLVVSFLYFCLKLDFLGGGSLKKKRGGGGEKERKKRQTDSNPGITCSVLAIETPEQGVKHIQI